MATVRLVLTTMLDWITPDDLQTALRMLRFLLDGIAWWRRSYRAEDWSVSSDPVPRTARPCLDCGVLTTTGPRCSSCFPVERSRRNRARGPRDDAARAARGIQSSTARGYDAAWRRLSEAARRIQDWCTDCGTREDLTTDHSEGAWARKNAGLPIRLCDVVVLCGPCNNRRGKRRHLTALHFRSDCDAADPQFWQV